MLNLFRRHVSECPNYGKRMGQKCPRKPPCPIHYEGMGGNGKRIRSQALTDPQTGNGVRDWARACELVRDMEAPTPTIAPITRTTIADAIEHFLKLKTGKASDTYHKSERLLGKLRTFMEASPRAYQYITDIRFVDLTDFCSSWTGANRTKLRDLGILTSFFKFCHRADFTPKHIGDGLFKTMNWPDDEGQREPFTSLELESLWKVLPNLPNEYGRLGQPIAKQTEVFVLLMRYTGLDVSTMMNLPKSHVRGNKILTYRLKNGSEVWTVVPEWVVQRLQAAPHDSSTYFFWSGEGKKHTRASKWFARLRKLLDLAGLQHRTPHNFRHHFAIEHLLSGNSNRRCQPSARAQRYQYHDQELHGMDQERQVRLEGHQQRVWDADPLHQRMAAANSDCASAQSA